MQSTDCDCGQRPRVELSFRANVEESSFERDGCRESGKNQRCGAGERFAKREHGTEAALKQQRVSFANGRTGPQHEKCCDQKRHGYRCDWCDEQRDCGGLAALF